MSEQDLSPMFSKNGLPTGFRLRRVDHRDSASMKDGGAYLVAVSREGSDVVEGEVVNWFSRSGRPSGWFRSVVGRLRYVDDPEILEACELVWEEVSLG